MRLYLIRHAQSYNNALADQRDRVADPALTDKGEDQARRLADYVAQAQEMPDGPFVIDQLYCSPMLRTLQTSQPLASALGLTPRIWPEIHEIGGIFLAQDGGSSQGFPGMTRAEINERIPGYEVPDAVTDAGWWDVAVGRETPARFLGRAIHVALALQDMIRSNPDARIALVSHAAFLDALIKAILGQIPTHPNQLFYVHYNTGITRFDFGEHRDQMQLQYLNRSEHLPDSLRSW